VAAMVFVPRSPYVWIGLKWSHSLAPDAGEFQRRKNWV
jgi:hypothetical protein